MARTTQAAALEGRQVDRRLSQLERKREFCEITYKKSSSRTLSPLDFTVRLVLD